jgi:hypothetical protein
MVWLRGVALTYLPTSAGVAAYCQQCDRRVVWTHRELVLICAPDTSLDPLRKLACSSCDRPADDLWITWPSVLKSRP